MGRENVRVCYFIFYYFIFFFSNRLHSCFWRPAIYRKSYFLCTMRSSAFSNPSATTIKALLSHAFALFFVFINTASEHPLLVTMQRFWSMNFNLTVWKKFWCLLPPFYHPKRFFCSDCLWIKKMLLLLLSRWNFARMAKPFAWCKSDIYNYQRDVCVCLLVCCHFSQRWPKGCSSNFQRFISECRGVF